MPRIDLPTLLMVSTALFGLMAVMFLITWRQDRRANGAMLYWAGSHLLGAPACVLLALRGEISAFLSIGVANTLVLAAFGSLLAGALAFEGRRFRGLAIVTAPAIWIAATQSPAVWGSFPVRVVLVSALIFALVVASAVVIWRGQKREALPTRPIVAVLLGLIAVGHLSRLILTVDRPASESFAALDTGWIAFIAMQILIQEVVLGYALLSMVKERGEARQRTAAEIDSLTRALTRRAFFERATARLAADPSRGAVLIFDLDRFKAINDTHGHLVGDRVLADFAGVVSARIGPKDVFGRFGGEEFVLFLAEADFAAAWRMAEAVRHDFGGLGIRNGVRIVDATVSVGVAAVPLIEPDLDRLVASADAGLYAAKQSGRDRVETVAEPVRRAPRSGRAV
jgi:diguanylate cyclase (GGDEF)-like protein